MNKELNKFERAIINEVIGFNDKEYSTLIKHLPYLNIKSRENTGVGMYVYFEYSEEAINLELNNFDNTCLSSNKHLELDNLEYGVNYELNITGGKVDFLELVTNGENWDGNHENFKFLDF